jgi:hypothetical protein
MLSGVEERAVKGVLPEEHRSRAEGAAARNDLKPVCRAVRDAVRANEDIAKPTFS